MTDNVKTSKENKKYKRYNKKPSSKVLEQEEVSQLTTLYKEVDKNQITSFADLPLSRKTQQGLWKAGYELPTDIQKEGILLALRGLDVLGAAKTGSGKTLTFLIPLLELLYRNHWSAMDGLGAMVITPTRELAYQIFEVLKKIGTDHDFSAGLIIGGKDLKFERQRMDKCNIIICTPGRILQHMDENPLFDCTNLQMLVLDEADRILDMGFEKTMNAIFENLPPKRQTLLFSATQTKSVRDLARLSLKDPEYISVHELSKYSTPDELKQSYTVCELHEKLDMLWSFIKAHKKQKILVFFATCKQVKHAYDIFCRMRPGMSVLSLYGTLHQLRRMAIYDEFCRKQSVVLFATDIAARGLDFPYVEWVLQLDCPEDVSTYIHRAGRTARINREGHSLLVLLPSEVGSMVEQLNSRKIPIEQLHVNLNQFQSVQRKMEAVCAKDVSIKEEAQRAFVAYLKNIFMMKDKTVFDIYKLDTDSYARSLGLAFPPRIRFLQKHEKLKAAQAKSKNPQTKIKAPSNEEEIFTSKEPEKSQNRFEFDESSDEDILVRKEGPARHELIEELEEINGTELESNKAKKKQMKPLTKVAVAKKALKKKIQINKKILFDDAGEAVEAFPREQKSQIALELHKEMDEKQDGINIDLAKKIMEEEDKVDKMLFRQRIKALHREQKLKLKEERGRRDKKDEDEIDFGDKESESEGEVFNKLIDDLPDPDKVYDNQEKHSKTGDKKRKSKAKSEKKKKPKIDINLDEELALQLLNS